MTELTIDGRTCTQHELECPECNAPMSLKPSRFGLFYGCSKWSETGCKGGHGAHSDGTPLGVPADGKTKKRRQWAHKVFDSLWKTSQSMSRSDAYLWMQQAMDLTKDEAHIGRFTIEQCERLIQLAHKQHKKRRYRKRRKHRRAQYQSKT